VALIPDVYSVLIGGLFSFFGTSATTLTVQEARGWDRGGRPTAEKLAELEISGEDARSL
jgi:hypothetical protein